MRKAYKRKHRSCALCKPHKVGWDKRWKPKEAAPRTESQRTILESGEKLGSENNFNFDGTDDNQTLGGA